MSDSELEKKFRSYVSIFRPQLKEISSEIEVVKKEYRSKLSSLGKKGRQRQHDSLKKAHELKIQELNAKAVTLAEKSGLAFFSMPGLDEDDANDTAAYYPNALSIWKGVPSSVKAELQEYGSGGYNIGQWVHSYLC